MKDSSSCLQQKQQQSSSLASTLGAMGLFVATVAVSQYIQIQYSNQKGRRTPPPPTKRYRRRRRRRRLGSRSTSCDEDYSNTGDGEFALEAFRRRRLARRMSFEQVDEDQPYSRRNSLTTDGEAEKSQQRGYRSRPQSPKADETVTEWSLHCTMGDIVSSSQKRFSQESTQLTLQQQQQQQQQQQRLLEKSRRQRNKNNANQHPRLDRELTTPHSNQSTSAPNYRYHDFHPKYQNWRHFEHFNEQERAKQKRKAQLLRQQQQKLVLLQQEQQQQRSSQHQQEAGEGASQKENVGQRRKTNDSVLSHRSPQYQKQSTIEQESDNDSVSTFDNERENDNDDKNDPSLSDSVTSFGSDNQYIWTGGNASECSFGSSGNATNLEKSDFPKSRFASKTKQSQDLKLATKPPNPNRLAIRSGTAGILDTPEAGSSGSSRNKTKTNSRGNDHRMGKFERFYRMLTSSIIEDDSNHYDGETGKPISLSSESTNFGSSFSFDYDGDIEDRHRALRTEYNAQIMPEKLVLIRHGQSMGNVDESFYATTPDNAMRITDLGWEQARKAGTILKDKIITPGESIHFIVSPYVRTVETFHGIVSAWCDPESEEFASIQDRNRKVNAWYERLTELGLTWNEDSRIREQDFGNYQNPEQTRKAKEERHRFGAFYYRFHNGESGSDVYDRVSTFLDSLWRSFETHKSQNYVLVTHGIVLRVLMARYFRYTITQLNTLANPRNCEMVVLGHEGNGRLDLEGRCSLELEEDPESDKKVVKGYKFHKRLRVLPKSNIRTVRFRISPMDQENV